MIITRVLLSILLCTRECAQRFVTSEISYWQGQGNPHWPFVMTKPQALESTRPKTNSAQTKSAQNQLGPKPSRPKTNSAQNQVGPKPTRPKTNSAQDYEILLLSSSLSSFLFLLLPSFVLCTGNLFHLKKYQFKKFGNLERCNFQTVTVMFGMGMSQRIHFWYKVLLKMLIFFQKMKKKSENKKHFFCSKDFWKGKNWKFELKNIMAWKSR